MSKERRHGRSKGGAWEIRREGGTESSRKVPGGGHLPAYSIQLH